MHTRPSVSSRAFRACCCLGLIASFVVRSTAADIWPTHLHDAARSGFTEARVELPLARQWVYRGAGKPDAAWAPPIPHAVEGNAEADRLDYDHAYQVAADERSVWFGSSADDRVYCVDQQTGATRWTFVTEGPVRLAPSLWQGKVYFGSDDGRVYCVEAATGKLVWQQTLGFNNRRQLGNGRLISRWPVRTAVLIDHGIAYCGAGVFPHEGIILAAFKADTGATVWRNNQLGEQNSNRSRLAPQGYLLCNDQTLIVPSGRDLPAGFNRADGTLRFHSSASWRAAGIVGGTYALLVDGELITGANQNVAFDLETGRGGLGWFEGRKMVVRGEVSYMAMTDAVVAARREPYAKGSVELLKLRERHDGRGADDPQNIWKVKRDEYNKERAKSAAKRDDAKVASLKAEMDRQLKRVREMEQEEKEFEAKFKSAATLWKTEVSAYAALIGTPDTIFAGGRGKVVALSAKTGEQQWSAPIDGNAAGLAVAGGRLIVSSDTGRVYCFAPGSKDVPEKPETPRDFPAGSPDETRIVRAAVDEVIASGPLHRGYALVLGLRSGRLAWELATRTGYKVIAIDSDPAVVDAVRKNLADTGLYGERLHVLNATPDQLPNYFANVVVSEDTLLGGVLPGAAKDVARLVRPLGGKVFLRSVAGAAVREWLDGLKFASVTLAKDGTAAGVAVRGALPGAGKWTHQYGTAGNSSFSDETRLTAPLGVLWYGDPGPTQMINRHWQGSPPVSLDGRMFIVGENVVFAYDSYNGAKLWEASYQGQSRYRTQSIPGNLVADPTGVYLATRDECLRFDPETGERLAVYTIPEKLRTTTSSWSYLGLSSGVLVGSVADTLLPASTRHSKALFAYRVADGRLLWTYKGDKIAPMTVALGDYRAFLVDSKLTQDQLEQLLREDRAHLKNLTGDARKKAEAKAKAADRRLAVALDLETGRKIWEQPLDLTDCTGISKAHGELMLMYQNGLLVFAGASGNGHYWQQFIAGEFKQRKIQVVDAVTGKPVWQKEANYRIRPILNGDTIIAEPWAYDLYTGKQKTRRHPLTGEQVPWEFIRTGHHCGHVATTENLMFFRSGSTAYYDLKGDTGVSHFSGMRTGCTINMIPANGLVHIPEASAGCQCLFAIQSTVTMEPVAEDRAWSIFTTPGAMLPVRTLHVNFGAPGDRRDEAGNLWLAYPRPASSRTVQPLEIPLEFEVGGKAGTYMDLPQSASITATQVPWVAASGYEGVTSLGVPVLGRQDRAGVYTVRMHFAELGGAAVGERRFDIVLQNRVVARNFDVRQAAGGSRAVALKEFRDVDIFDWLEIAFKPASGSRAPIISGLEIIHTGDSAKPKPVSLRYPPEWQSDKPTVILKPVADARVVRKTPDANDGGSPRLGVDGGASAFGDDAHSFGYLKFDLSKLPGKPVAAMLRLHCLGPGSRDAGTIHLAANDWAENKITYNHRPQPERRVGVVGNVGPKATVERTLILVPEPGGELTLVLQPTTTDGIGYGARESKQSPELVIAYEP